MKYVWLPWQHPIDRMVRSKSVHGASELHSNKAAAQQRQLTSRRYSLHIDSSMSIYSFQRNRLRIFAILFVSIFPIQCRCFLAIASMECIAMLRWCGRNAQLPMTNASYIESSTHLRLCTTFPQNAHTTPSISAVAHVISNVNCAHFFPGSISESFFRSISAIFCSSLPFSRRTPISGKFERWRMNNVETDFSLSCSHLISNRAPDPRHTDTFDKCKLFDCLSIKCSAYTTHESYTIASYALV